MDSRLRGNDCILVGITVYSKKSQQIRRNDSVSDEYAYNSYKHQRVFARLTIVILAKI